jgi:hypothetical protein
MLPRPGLGRAGRQIFDGTSSAPTVAPFACVRAHTKSAEVSNPVARAARVSWATPPFAAGSRPCLTSSPIRTTLR